MEKLGPHVVESTPAVAPGESVAACARLLMALGRRHLVVTDEAGRPTGLVTDLDVFRQGALVGSQDWVERPGAARTAGELAVPIDAFGLADDPLHQALDRLADSPQDVVVCVDEAGALVGLLGEHDVVALASLHLPRDLEIGMFATSQVITVRGTDPAVDALTVMLRDRRRHLVVVDAAGVVTGVLSLRDLLAGGVADGERGTCQDVANAGEVVLAREETKLREAATRMALYGVGCLPVVDAEGRPLAVLTRTDILRALSAHLREVAAVRVTPENAFDRA